MTQNIMDSTRQILKTEKLKKYSIYNNKTQFLCYLLDVVINNLTVDDKAGDTIILPKELQCIIVSPN